MSRLLQRFILFGVFTQIFGISTSQATPQRTLEVLADQVEMDLETGTTHFQKNVRIMMQQYRITCQSAVVRLNPKTRQLQEVVMQGSVVIQGKDGLLRGKKVTFLPISNRLHLEGPVYTRIQVDLPENFNP